MSSRPENIVPPPATGDFPDVAMNPSISNYNGLSDQIIPGLVERVETVEPPNTGDLPDVAMNPSVSNYNGLNTGVSAKNIVLTKNQTGGDLKVVATIPADYVVEDDLVITGTATATDPTPTTRPFTVTIDAGDASGESAVVFAAADDFAGYTIDSGAEVEPASATRPDGGIVDFSVAIG